MSINFSYLLVGLLILIIIYVTYKPYMPNSSITKEVIPLQPIIIKNKNTILEMDISHVALYLNNFNDNIVMLYGKVFSYLTLDNYIKYVKKVNNDIYNSRLLIDTLLEISNQYQL